VETFVTYDAGIACARMGEQRMVTGPLDQVSAESHSPDGQITATLTGRDQVRLRFQRGAYRRYDEGDLGHQLSQLATRTWVDYQRKAFAALSEEIGQTVRGDERSDSQKATRYHDALAAATARGTSEDGWIEITSTGLVRWRVRVYGGACTRLREEEFLAEAGSALADLLEDFYEQRRALRETILGEAPENPIDEG
jgi:hypothetical protein